MPAAVAGAHWPHFQPRALAPKPNFIIKSTSAQCRRFHAAHSLHGVARSLTDSSSQICFHSFIGGDSALWLFEQWWSTPFTSLIVMVSILFQAHTARAVEAHRLIHHSSPAAAECIYKRRWLPRPTSAHSKPSRPVSGSTPISNGVPSTSSRGPLSAEDDAKLIFGTVFSLRNMVRKLGGDDDK